jgi:cytochrome c oxidase subunit 2
MTSQRRRILLTGAAAATALAGLAGAIAVRAQPAEKVISIRARRFTYEPDEITLKLNEPVVLEFTSADVVMGFRAPDFGVRTDIFPGRTTRVRLVPDKVGSFVFHCDIFCGDGHEDMDGTIRVVA